MITTSQNKSEIDRFIDINSVAYIDGQSLKATKAHFAKKDWSNGAKWMYEYLNSRKDPLQELKDLLAEREFVENDKNNVSEVEKILNTQYIVVINSKIKKLLNL